MASDPSRNYTSRLSIPYTPHSSLNTLDIHQPTHPPKTPSYWLIYIHGGAFRDPLQTSQTLLPNLPTLFQNPHLTAIASLNYRLSPHPTHPTHPSNPADKSRNVVWPTHINDVKDAVGWLKSHEMGEEAEFIVVGHSVGATMALMLGMRAPRGDGCWGRDPAEEMRGCRGVVGLEGMYDFGACRDAHLEQRELYETFIAGAFGREVDGGWERGNVLGRDGEVRVREGVEVVVVAHSQGDELVEVGQSRVVEEALARGRHGDGRFEVRFVEVVGGHKEVECEGTQVGKAVGCAVQVLLSKRGIKFP